MFTEWSITQTTSQIKEYFVSLDCFTYTKIVILKQPVLKNWDLADHSKAELLVPLLNHDLNKGPFKI